MSAFRILHEGDVRLIIENPPMGITSCVFAVLAAVGAILVISNLFLKTAPKQSTFYVRGKFYNKEDITSSWSGEIVGGFLLLVFGYSACLSHSTSSLILDRDSNTYRISRINSLLSYDKIAGSMDDIDDAALEMSDASERFVIILHNGERLALGPFTQQDNQSKAVQSVKHFLAGED